MKNIKSIDPLFKFELSTSSKSVFSFFQKKKKEHIDHIIHNRVVHN